MSSQVTITQLPAAGPITGSEVVPVVQNGVTVKTTAAALAGSPVQNQTFLTLNQESTLTNSRYLGATNGLTLTASSPQGVLNVTTTGALLSLVNSGTGFQVKTDATTLTGRSISGGTGISVSNGDGVSGDPSVSIANTSVTPGSYNAANITVNAQGQITSAASSIAGLGTVQQVNTGTGLTGGPITTTGTVSIANTAVNPGSYTTANITVNAQGQITAASNGTAGVTSVTGTANEVTVFPTTGDAVVSLPSALTFTGKTVTGGTYASPEITGTVKLTGSGASSYTPFVQTFSSASTNYNGYQLNYIQNVNNGSDASVDYVAYNDASDVDSYFIDMGISSSNYTNATYTIFPANGGYVYTGGGTSGQASALLLGTSNAASDIILFSGGTLLANTRATIKGNTGNFLVNTSTDTGYKLNVSGTTYFGGASTFGSTVLLNADPTLALQAATKQYVDASAGGGFVVHPSVVLASVAALPSCTYSNGASGVGATLTATANGALSIDATAVTSGIRVLVKDQAAGAQNGVYTVTQVGSAGTPFILTRATDFDTAAAGEIANNAYFFITGGVTQAGDSYVLSVIGTITVGTTALTFTLFADQQVYTGGTNITVAGQVINVSGTIAATLGGTGTSTVATGDLLYGSGTNAWSKLSLGIGYKSLVVNAGGTQVEWNAVALNQTAAVSGQLGTGNGGTGLSTYTAGDLLYYASGTALSKLTLGTSGYVLTAGASAPAYVAQSTLSVGSATTATNIAGGAAGSLPYNTGAGATSFLALGTSGYVLTAGASAPAYVAQSTLSVGSAATLTTTRAIYGNNFNGSAALTQVIASTYGGTGNGFTKFTGPATAERTFTLPNADATILTSNAAVTPAQGGTGVANNAASTLTISGSFGTTLTVSGTTTVTLPTTGTLSTLAGTETLTNKRIDPRFLNATTGTSVTPDISSYDQYNWTALASNFTFNAPTGTPVNGNKLMFRITPSGTPTLTWNATYTPIGVTLPTTTTSGKTVYVGCIYNADLTRWEVVAVSIQA